MLSAGQYCSAHSVLVMPTCNKFDHHFVYQQWQEVKRLYDQELKGIVGPLIGGSSDGDSRRRKIMLQLATVNVGNRFRPIDRNLGFVFSCRKLDKDETCVIKISFTTTRNYSTPWITQHLCLEWESTWFTRIIYN